MTADPSRSSLLIDATLLTPPVERPSAPTGPGDEAPHDHVVRARALGQLDRTTLPLLTEALLDAGRRGLAVSSWATMPAVELELSGLTFLCTCGVSALNEAWQQLSELGLRLCLTGPRPQALSVLDVAMFSGWLPPGLECDQDHPWPAATPPAARRHRVNLASSRPRLTAGRLPPKAPRGVATQPAPRLPGGAA